jgi:hypothetical protein
MKHISILLFFVLASCCHDGDRGSPGPAGPKGNDGTPAIQVVTQPATALQCANGGIQVSIGTNVQVICNGVDGATGPQGAPGLNGSTGPQGTPGLNGSNGSDGPQGVPGLNGSDGSTGPQGSPGLNGSNGHDATPVTSVQFCPHVTPSYPSTFPELGLCIADQMYGVYSDHGGFLALLPPGQYSSNGINASCTFNILSHCIVQ